VVLVTLSAIARDGVDRPAAATGTIAKVQGGPLGNSSTGSLVLTLPASTTASGLVVASLLATSTTPSFSAPAGWVRGPHVASASGSTEIWYYPNVPAGITSVTFTFTSGLVAGGQLSEWSGVATTAPLDQSGTATATGATSVAVATAGATSAAGELGITSFEEALSSSQTVTFTPGTGWTNLISSAGTNYTAQFSADQRLGLAAGTINETETSSKSGTWVAVIATFKVACTGGALSLGSPGSLSWPAVTLNGVDQSTSTNVALSPSDMTGSGSGWNVQGTSTTLTNVSGAALPTTATTVTAASVAAASGNCSLPTNSISYPVALPAAATAPTAAKLYNAGANTGAGPTTLTLTFKLSVPASARSGSYSSTFTFSIVSGP
jgi:hypothetical protein